jgi:large subunit ribosomal protein L29
MAIIKKNELIQMNEKALDEKLRELKIELVKINAQRSMGTMPENPGKIKEIRKTIARINTIKKLKGGNEKA